MSVPTEADRRRQLTARDELRALRLLLEDDVHYVRREILDVAVNLAEAALIKRARDREAEAYQLVLDIFHVPEAAP